MKREFNGRPLELLAPAGTFDIYRDIIDSACDAVYLGGQILNMRMIRKGYNLSNTELREAVGLANERDKKLYVTVNSLLDEGELSQAEDYLYFLSEIQPHGLIVQDPAILDIVQRKKLNLPLHSSVMMNVHNLDMIRFLEKQGVSRVVLSREMSLKDAKALSLQTDMELEYFTHGDMCVTHGAQCLYSSYLFGMSGNRGRCLKPCRWSYSRPGHPDDKAYPLAVKDLSLYSHVGDMVLAGISSFKIEGRMRQKEFICDLINRYGEALDRFLDDPLGASHADISAMEPFKKRDFSTAYAFGIPGIANINSRGEGSGKFYSSGKMFSTPTKEKEISVGDDSRVKRVKGDGGSDSGILTDSLNLFARVNSPDQARLSLKYGVRRIYLSTEPFAPDPPVTLEELNLLSAECEEAGTELFLSLPRMTGEDQNVLFLDYLKKKLPVKGFLIGHSGMLELLGDGGWDIICDTSMNIYNSRAVQFYADRGACGWAPSLELPFKSLLAQAAAVRALGCSAEGEVILHGLPTMMYMDHDVSQKREDLVELQTPESILSIHRDWWNRYHLLPHKELSLLPRLSELVESGYRNFRLELQGYDPSSAEEVLRVCRESLRDPSRSIESYQTLTPLGGGFTYGAQQF